MSLARYYAWLARFQDAARLVAHDTGQNTFTVHRRLRGGAGEVSGRVLHERVLRALDATDGAGPATLEVLDAGCGLGGTIFALHARRGGRYLGITLSPEQAARAAAEAARRGVADACRFVVRDYDTSLDDLIPDGVDLDRRHRIARPCARPGRDDRTAGAAAASRGRLLIVDDVPRDTLPHDDPDFAAFRAGWLCPAVADDATLAAALARAGLTPGHDEDLTPLIPPRGQGRLHALIGLSRLAAPVLGRTSATLLLGALHGGLRLERLYRRGVVRYRLIVARRTDNL